MYCLHNFKLITPQLLLNDSYIIVKPEKKIILLFSRYFITIKYLFLNRSKLNPCRKYCRDKGQRLVIKEKIQVGKGQ